MKQPRLGHINFINCLPLTYGLLQGGLAQGITVQADTPSSLNDLVVKGMLDASPVSSIVYARHSEHFLILPDVSISADGGLQSILLVSKRPITQLNGARVALTAKSATSHGLLKIIMHHAYACAPQYFVSTLSLDAGVLDEAEAVLFIGDDALYAYHNRIAGYYYYDLGNEWKKMTGLAMVYAVWVVNRQFAKQYPEMVQLIYERVTGGFAFGLSHLDDAADTMIGKMPFTTEQICYYLSLLNYQLTPEYQQALLTYYRLAHGLGLIPVVPDLAFAEVK